MSHYAKVENGIVTKVIVAEQDFINTLPDPSSWIQTSYNTHGGVHLLGGIPLRKNFAGIGYTYDLTKDAFIGPQPFPSWVLDENTCLWEAPKDCPQDGQIYIWDENNLNWILKD